MFPVITDFLLPWGNLFSVAVYGTALYLGILICLILFLNSTRNLLGRSEALAIYFRMNLYFWAGSALVWLIFRSAFPAVIANPKNGFFYPAGALFALLELYRSTRGEAGRFGAAADALVFSALPAMILSGFAAFFAASDFGTATTLGIGILYDSNPIGVPFKGAVHPVQLYNVFNLLQIWVMLLLVRQFAKREGLSAVLFVLLWMIFGFILQFFRGDLLRSFFGLTFEQFVSLCILVIALPLGIFSLVKNGAPSMNSIRKKTKSLTLYPLLDFLKFKIKTLDDLKDTIVLLLILILPLPLISIPGHFWNDIRQISEGDTTLSMDTDRIFINIPAMKLFYRGSEYMISPGRPDLQTPLGMGTVASKRDRIRFVYTVGWRKGEVIKFGHTLDGRVYKIPYEKMRGLGLKLGGFDDYVIHSTTEDWSIGAAGSSGCIRTRIPDMLELYDQVKIGTPVVIDYILCELDGNMLILYEDVYGLKSCIVEGEKTEFFQYTYDMVLRKTRKEISMAKFLRAVEETEVKDHRQMIPLRDVLAD